MQGPIAHAWRRGGVAVMTGLLAVAGLALSAGPAAGFGTSTPQAGPPTISAGGYMTCGIRPSDSNAVCWGNNVSEGPNQSNPPAGVAFTAVSAGYNYGCGIKPDQTLACWGGNASLVGVSYTPPAGTFTHVVAGVNVACGLRTDATIACWGNDAFLQVSGAPAGTFTQLAMGSRYACAFDAGTITCWGDNTYGQKNTPVPPVGLTYTQITTGNFDTCAILSDGTVDCWGRNAFGQNTVPAGTFTKINAGFANVCGLRPDQTITCWGRNLEGENIVPPGTYTDVTVGTFHVCAMRTDNVPVCWGNNAGGRVRPVINMPTTNGTGNPPPPIVVGTPYSYQIATSFVAPAYAWSVVKGSLPPGITLTPGGLLSGTATGSGRYNFTVRASNGYAPTITRTFTTNGPVVFQQSTGTWSVQGGATVSWGTSGDIGVPGDYNGDSLTDFAVFRPSTGTWYVNSGPTVQWGTNGDIPVPADYNGDGVTDIAVFRPSTGIWYVLGGTTVEFGTSGDTPVPGDYDGDGDSDVAVFRPSTGVWYVLTGVAPTNNTAYSTPLALPGVLAWGTAGDIAVPGDYDHNGLTDVAVYRPSTGVWYIRGAIPDFNFGPNQTINWGAPGDIPVPSDYDGDNNTDVAVFRPSTGEWLVRNGLATIWGGGSDTPVPGYYFP